jgi:hypothetical protein
LIIVLDKRDNKNPITMANSTEILLMATKTQGISIVIINK